MSIYAFVRNDVVDNLVVADQAFVDLVAGEGLYDTALLVDDLDVRPGIGWTYDAGTGEFAAPVVPEPVAPDPAPEPAPVEEQP